MAVYRGELSLSDVLETCKNCKLAPMCLPNGLAGDHIEKIEKIVRRIPSINTNKHIYQFGDPFDSLYIVRSGCIKEYTNTKSGDEQVFGFKYTGEIFGLDSINKINTLVQHFRLLHHQYARYLIQVLSKYVMISPVCQSMY